MSTKAAFNSDKKMLWFAQRPLQSHRPGMPKSSAPVFSGFSSYKNSLTTLDTASHLGPKGQAGRDTGTCCTSHALISHKA